MRAILDTNVLLSGLLVPGGIPALLIEAWLDRSFTLISHAIQLEEIREVSRRDKIRALVRPAAVGRLVNQITLIADMPDKLPVVARLPDPRDDFLLALCEAGAADWLVARDKADVLALGHHGTTQIFSARSFANQLGLSKQ
jgi:putative PIN family toxin of toxin-antitoxin system